jgi:RNA polymerase sigma-70 factor (ECF subfamily)
VSSTQSSWDLESVYRQHCAFVWRNARRLGCDDHLADDVVHEVFLVVARRMSEFRHQASMTTWLFAITFRVVQRLFRDRSRRAQRLESYQAELQAEPSAQPHARSDAGDYLRHLLAQLNETQRVVFILSELEGMTSAEIGRCLGVKPGTIDSRLRAARTKLSRMIERERARERSRAR